MSESVIRIPSQQSLINATNNLVDIIIPGNSGVYDLSSTYISLLSRVSSSPAATPVLITGETETGIYDIRVHMDHQKGAAECIYDNVATPIECLVQSCSMSSASKGGVEDIRRSDILRGTLSVYKEDLDSRQAKALTTWSGACKDTPWVHGQNVELRGVGDVRSREVTHELRFNLKDLFDAGEFEAWDSSVYGDTRIHLELNLSQIQLTQCQGASDITWARSYQSRVTAAEARTFDIPNFGYKTCQTQFIAANAVAAATKTLVMKTPYDSVADVPFWVGQDVTITPKNVRVSDPADALTLLVAFPPQTGAGGIAQGAEGDPGRAIIKEIAFNKLTGIVSLIFANDVLGVAANTLVTNAGTLECSVIGSDVAATSPAISYEACELVATMRSDMRMGQAPQEHQFSRFVFQGDQFSNPVGTQRTYQIPANCTAVLMAITSTANNHSSFLGSAEVQSYRFAINGEAVTNRKVTYAETGAGVFKCKTGSSLHYDLLQKTFLNMGPTARYESMLESVFDQLVPVDEPGTAGSGQGWTEKTQAPRKSAFLLGVPIPTSQESSQLLLELDGIFTGGASINIYSYVTTSV